MITVMIDDLFQSSKSSIMHIRGCQCNIAQRHHPEPSSIIRRSGDLLSPRIFRHAVQPIVMIQLTIGLGTAMTMTTAALAIEKLYTCDLVSLPKEALNRGGYIDMACNLAALTFRSYPISCGFVRGVCACCSSPLALPSQRFHRTASSPTEYPARSLDYPPEYRRGSQNKRDTQACMARGPACLSSDDLPHLQRPVSPQQSGPIPTITDQLTGVPEVLPRPWPPILFG